MARTAASPGGDANFALALSLPSSSPISAAAAAWEALDDFLGDDDAQLAVELLGGEAGAPCAPPVATAQCHTPSHRRGCTECVASRGEGAGAARARASVACVRAAAERARVHATRPGAICAAILYSPPACVTPAPRCTLAPSPEEGHLYKLVGDAGRCATRRAFALL